MQGRRNNIVTDELLYISNLKGVTAKTLALDLRCSERQVWRRIARGRERFEGRDHIPWINWIQGNGLWKEFKRDDRAECNHQPIQIGDAKGCLRCLITGLDDTKALQPIPAIELDVTLPDPPKPKETRKQKRSKLASVACTSSGSRKSS